MIHRIYSDLKSFKEVHFQSGLNVMLADKTPEATDRHTRNGSGKSSLVQLIHFLMGANCDKDSLFKTDALRHSVFGMEVDLANALVEIQRSGQKASKVKIIGETEKWPLTPPWEKKSGDTVLSNTNWRDVLGSLLFGLPDDTEDSNTKYKPSFRSLFSYFVRRQDSGAFMLPHKQANMQQTWDEQVALSYLLGLDWTVPQQLQYVRERERVLRELKKAAGEGAFGTIIGTSAEVRTKLIVAEERTRRLREDVEKFQVLNEYRELEEEASKLTKQMSELSNGNLIDREAVLEMEESIVSEEAPSFDDLERLYQEAGVALPDVALRRIKDVRFFHEGVVSNRKSYLQGEIQAAEQRMTERTREMERLSKRRSEIMELLQSHGALDQHTKIQTELARIEAQTESLRQQLATAEQLEGGKTELDIERAQIQLRLKQDHQEQEDVIRKAILTFENISSSLYEKAGSLQIEETANGPKFEVRIQGAKSKGINNMQIFCFDLMLMILCTERGIGPRFLVHDSHLFDGVDDRQVARALYLGAQAAEKHGFQYIVTMNSNDLPTHYPDDFEIESYILPLRLTDATEDGGLFGIRFQ